MWCAVACWLQQQGCLYNDTIVPAMCRWNIRALVMARVLGPMCLITDSGRTGIGCVVNREYGSLQNSNPGKKDLFEETEGKRGKTKKQGETLMEVCFKRMQMRRGNLQSCRTQWSDIKQG